MRTRRIAFIDNPITWPGGAKCAVAITLDLDADTTLWLKYPETAQDQLAALSRLRYGPDVAIPRLIRLFNEYELKQTFFIPGWCAERYPEAVDALVAAGHEIAHHGYMHERVNQLSRSDEHEILSKGITALEAITGERPIGYRAPYYAISSNTPSLLLEEGFQYDSSLLGDDLPYNLKTADGSLLELPVDIALDDWTQFAFFKEFDYVSRTASARDGFAVFEEVFDAVWNHGGIWISVWHPFLMGRLAQMVALQGFIERAMEKGSVWFATLQEISDHVLASQGNGEWTPRTVEIELQSVTNPTKAE